MVTLSSIRVTALALAAAAMCVAAQDPFAIYNQTKRLPDGCIDGYTAGSDTVLYTIPYTYKDVLSIIGSFKNLSWSGNPPNTVTLNGTDNTVGTSRTYTSAGAQVVETLTLYMKPNNGPYAEIHTLAPLTISLPSTSTTSSSSNTSLSFYSAYDANFALPTCPGGTATLFNETIHFCATNATLAASVFHDLHLADVRQVGTLLGGGNFSSCAALGNGNSTVNGTATGTVTNTAAVGTKTSVVNTAVVSSTSVVASTTAAAAPAGSASAAAKGEGVSGRSGSGSGLGLVGSVVMAVLGAVVGGVVL